MASAQVSSIKIY